MLRRLFHFTLFLAVLSCIDLAHALPAPADLKKRDQRLSAITPTPTSTPVAQSFPKALPVTATTTTSTTAPAVTGPATKTRVVPATNTVATTSARTTDVMPVASTTAEPAATSSGQRSGITVVLDPGHGGFDRGGIAGQRVPESVMNLDVALRVRRLLQANGYRVVMTRETDVFIPLGTRVAIGNSYRNGIFVCIHFNSATRSAANGIETYFFSQQSLQLASAIHYYVNQVAPTPNRGVRRRGFFVLRRSTIPAILVECGFLTNPTEAQYAQSGAYRDKLAAAIVRGIQSRGSVGNAPVATGGAASTGVPLQPFIDQTHTRDPDIGRSHHVKGSSKGKKSGGSSRSKKKKKKSSDSEE